jgi:xanthine dehydrogenase YagT iron-sulfur-binding subunit
MAAESPQREHKRRTVLKAGGAVVAGAAANPLTAVAEPEPGTGEGATDFGVPIVLTVNGKQYPLIVEPRVTLLDALRERLHITGPKKGCDRGACGACTVLAGDRRIKSCQTLAVMRQHDSITTVEGLAHGDRLHAVQEAFIRQDAFQCGACTSGQIMSAVAVIAEGHTGSAEEIREWMSGNLCRCAAYPNIVAAVQDAAKELRT